MSVVISDFVDNVRMPSYTCSTVISVTHRDRDRCFEREVAPEDGKPLQDDPFLSRK